MAMRPSTDNPTRPRARKRFGQHFLEPVWAAKVVAAIAPAATDTILEIGPGPGAITYPLADRAQDVVAFEIDRDLAAALRASGRPNLHVIEGDFLNVTAARLRDLLSRLPPASRLRVAGNLPYNVASPILFSLTALVRDGIPLVDASVMLQREVAERLLAPPDRKEYGVLSVLIRQHADVTRLLPVPPGAFRPSPQVQSAVVRLRFHAPDPSVLDERLFVALTQAVFTRRRKTLANALLAHPGATQVGPTRLLEQAAIDGRRRPETLTGLEFGRLSDVLARLLGSKP